MIVRNYFESMISIHKDIQTVQKIIQKSKSYYFDILQLYDSWNSNKRLLIYYEDLIQDFENQMKKMLSFLEIDDNNLQSFMENYENLSEQCLHAYTITFGLGSGGKDLLFHSKNIPRTQLKKIEVIIKRQFPDLWHKYLTRYAVDNYP